MAQTAQWTKTPELDTLEATAPAYNSSAVTYEQSSVYYNGYNPSSLNTTTLERADWDEVDENV